MNYSYETFNSYFNADHLQSASLILTMKHDANEAKKKKRLVKHDSSARKN